MKKSLILFIIILLTSFLNLLFIFLTTCLNPGIPDRNNNAKSKNK